MNPQRPERMRIDLNSIEFRSPIWRVLSVAALCAAFVTFGMWLSERGSAESVALVAVIALAKMIGYWTDHLARLRPPSKPGLHVPTEVKNLLTALRGWLHARPLVVCALFGLAWGLATLVAKNIATSFFEQLYSPWLAIALGSAVGAIIAAPEFLRRGAERLGWTNEETAESEDSEEAEPEDESDR